MSNINLTQQHKSRRTLILVLVVFALPIILAKLALMENWLDYGVTNKGHLITNELSLSQLGLDTNSFDHKWLLLYTLPNECSLHCEKTLETVHNAYIALGREMPRVAPVALVRTDLSSQQQQQISLSKWAILPMPDLAKNLLNHPQVFIVDPLGNIVLSHEIPNNNEELSQFGKQILADFKKLLKYSRVG